MEELVRRKRIDFDGYWEYECDVCKLWLPQKKFRGCINYVDAYGNCLMCSSCRAKLGQQHKQQNEQELLKEIMVQLGFDPYSEKPVWQQFHDRHNLPYPK